MRASHPLQDILRFLSDTLDRTLIHIQTPVFLTQAAIVVAGGVLAWWLSRLARGPLQKLAARLPPSWAPGFLRIAEHVSFPLHWLGVLGVGAVTGLALDLDLPLIDAAFDLVLAWICIRLLSFTVKSHAGSVVITVAVFTVAALNILDVWRPLLKWLGRVHVYDARYTHVSLLGAIDALIILVVLLWAMRLLHRFLERRLAAASSLTPSLQILLNQLIRILLPVIAMVIALQAVGVDLTTLTVAFGALGIGVGLGLQKAVSNFVSGLSLIVSKSIKPGDILKYQDTFGWVTNMSARYVTLRTFGGVELLIPNDYFIENGVENWSYTDATVALSLPVGISYDADPRAALALCREAAEAVPRVLKNPAPTAAVKEFGDSSINLEVYFWIDDPRGGTANVKSEVLLAIWDRFKAAGISIPYPQRVVRMARE